MKKLILILLVAAFGCSTPSHEPLVKSIGELRQIMHQGQYQSRVRLDTLVRNGLYGLGAIDSLAGELLILDGVVFKSSVNGDSVQVVKESTTEATLLIYAYVAEWDTVTISNPLDLDSELSKVMSLYASFPFMLIGKQSLDYHVINFDTKNGDISKHKEGAFKGSITDTEVTILGFYSTNAKGIYTHHDSSMHMHFMDADQTIMGHVDELNVEGSSFKLLIPKQ